MDFLFDDITWGIRYVVVEDTQGILEHKRLISPQWFERISWPEERIFLDLSRRDIERAPPYDPAAPITREYENTLFDYYGRQKYWL